MGYSVFPAPATSSGGSTTQFITIPNSTTQYITAVDLSAGVYSFTGTIANQNSLITLVDANGSIILTFTLTSNTPAVVNLATACKKIRASTFKTGTEVSMQVQISLTGTSLVSTTISGTLETITTTQAYSHTGLVYIIAVGGGGAGMGTQSSGYAGTGGSSGAVVEYYGNISGAHTLTIGQGGIREYQTYLPNSKVSGGNTSFGNLFTANGGFLGGNGGWGIEPPLPTATGTYDFAGGSQGRTAQNTTIYNAKYQWVKTGGVVGGRGGSGAGAQLNAGFGIAGGGSQNYDAAKQDATGFGCGGGGHENGATGGGVGAQGVIYILKNITQ